MNPVQRIMGDKYSKNKMRFGSIKWQEEMLKGINHKMENNEELSPQEVAYLDVQHQNKRLGVSVKVK
jgi:hypothetical protein